MMKPLLAIPLFAIGCASLPASQRAPGRYSETLDFGGRKRSYVVFVPKAAQTRAVPAVVALHGWTGSASGMANLTEMAKYSEREGFIGIVPNGTGELTGWNAGWIDLAGGKPDDVGFIERLLNRTESEFRVDKKRVFVFGYSNGAFLTNLIASRLGSRIAAFASVAGTIGTRASGKEEIIPRPKTPVSGLFLHGQMDPTVSYDGTIKALLTGISAPDSADFWAKINGTNATPSKMSYAFGKATRQVWFGGKNGTEVELIATKRGTHDFPGGLYGSRRENTHGIVAMDEIVRFFRDHPKR